VARFGWLAKWATHTPATVPRDLPRRRAIARSSPATTRCRLRRPWLPACRRHTSSLSQPGVETSRLCACLRMGRCSPVSELRMGARICQASVRTRRLPHVAARRICAAPQVGLAMIPAVSVAVAACSSHLASARFPFVDAGTPMWDKHRPVTARLGLVRTQPRMR
jgi:hypothetical protein